MAYDFQVKKTHTLYDMYLLSQSVENNSFMVYQASEVNTE